MNSAYKLVWNTTLQAWVVASELAKGRKKSSGRALKVAVLLLSGLGASGVQAAPAAAALPTGESVTSGTATFDRTVPNQLSINQSTAKLITNWSSFNVGSAGKVTFAQPGASSIALNRVTTGSATEIFGQITANGQVVIVNPNGIVFGAGSQVSATSVVASSLDITDTSFNNSNYQFTRGSATGSVSNAGTITTTGGTVALLAPSITNTGTITATGGFVGLVSANQATLSTTTPTINQASSIAGTIKNTGTIQATQVSSNGGRILISGDKSQSSSVVELAGTLQAFDQLDVAGKTIKVFNTLSTTGTATTFTADDNILVNATINTTGASDVLNLVYGADANNAANENYTLNRNGKINLNGASSGFKVNGTSYTVLRTLANLQTVAGSGKYVLANNIDASSLNTGLGFNPLNISNGIFDGLGHAVTGLFINRPTQLNVGLFGSLNNSRVQNISVTGATVSGKGNVGILAGSNNASSNGTSIITNAYTTGTVRGYAPTDTNTQNVGGLVGVNVATTGGTALISNSGSAAAAYGHAGNNSNIAFTASYYGVGGLVGYNTAGIETNSLAKIISSYATGSATGVANGDNNATTGIGGLVGMNSVAGAGNAQIDQSFSTANVSGGVTQSGGLVGTNSSAMSGASTGTASITNSYASGNTSGTYYVGGLVGWNEGFSVNTASVSYSFANGAVSNSYASGGVVGFNVGASFNNYWNSDTTGKGSAIGINQGGTSSSDAGLNNGNIKNVASYGNWGSRISNQGGQSSIWRIYEGLSTPLLRSLLLPTTVTASATKTFDGTTYSGGAYVSSDPLATFLGTASYSGASQGAKNVGTYALNISGLYSNQLGYDVVLQNGSLIINKALLGVGSSANVTKTYDGTTAATGTINVRVGSLFGSDTISGGSLVFSNKNAGSGNKIVVASGVTVNDGNSGNNYDLYYVPNTTSTINKANLSLSTSNVSKTYDGTTSATGSATVTAGSLVGGDTISGGTFAFGNKHAGTGKTVITSAVTISDGNSGNNYNVTYVDNTNSIINKANLTISIANMAKTYDGTTSANGTLITAGGTQVFGSDSLSGGTFAFTNKNAGTGKTVNVSGVTVNDGNSGNNYNVSYADNTNSSINKANLTISIGNVIKTYDGTTSANGTAIAAGGTQLFGSDFLSGGSFAFTNKNAGTSKTVTVSGVTLNDGNAGNNYNVSYANNTGSTINKANLFISSSDVSKTYDGTISAAGNAVVVSGSLLGGDSISGGSFSFDNKHAGTGKTVNVSGVTLSDGNSGNNYNVSYAPNTTSSISKANLVLTTSNVIKTYNGTTATAGTALATSGTQVFSGDSLSGGSFAFTDKNAGTGKTVTTSGVTVNDGNSGNNYNVTYADNTASTINKANLVLTTTDVTKTYDGTTAAAGTALATSGTQVFSGDSLSGGSFAFTNKNAGTGKTVTTSGVTVNDGNSGNNYNVTYANNTSSTINKANLVLTTTDVTKTYDGTNAAAGTAVASSGTQVFGGDNLLGGTFTYDTKHAGTGKTVATSAVTVDDGNGGNNYTVTYADNTNSTINKANLVLTTADVTKTYDGTNTAAGTAVATSGTQVFAGDNLTGGTFAFDTRNAGTGKTVTTSAVTVDDGNSGNNYTVTYADNTNSTINKANLVLTTTDVTKTYDGTNAAAGTAVATSGTQVFSGDSLNGGTFAFDTKNAGTGKTVSTTGVTVSDGNGGNNYSVTYADNTNSTINKANLVLTTTDVTKTYDGTNTAAGTAVATSGTQVFGGDNLLGGTFTYDSKNAGTGKTVTTSAVTVDDGNSGNNYTVTYADNTNSSINKANLVLTTTDVTKTYDGTNTAAGTAVATSGTQVFSGDNLTGGTFAFDTKNAGTGKTVTTSAVTVDDGNSGNNYTVTYADNTNSTINKANLVLTTTDVTRTYDGTTAAAGTAVATSGTQVFSGDSLTGGTFAFDTKNAGTGKTVTTSAVTVDDGNSGNNYTVTYADNTNSTVNKANLVLTTTDVTKTYDGTTAAAGTAVATSGTQVFSGDSISGGTFTYGNKNAGAGKTVTTSAVTVSDGNSGNNYTVTYADNSSSSINKANLSITSSNVTKTYDGTTDATAIALVTGGTQLFGSDAISGGTFTFDTKHAGAGKTVSTAAVALNDGNSGNNYNVTYVANNTNTVNKALLTLQAVADSKVYDGLITSANRPLTVGRQRGDNVTGLRQEFADKNAGTGKTIHVASGYVVNDGNGGNNYIVTVQDSHAGVITPASLTLTAVTDSKVYDGLTRSTGRPLVSGIITGDRVTGLAQEFADKNVATGKTINIGTGYVIEDGNGGHNYVVTKVSDYTGVVTPATLTIRATNETKVYDGTVSSSLAPAVTGLKDTDTVTGLLQQFADKNVGIGKAINIASGYTVNDGNGGSNYTVTLINSTGGRITPKALLISAIPNTKVYDGGVTSANKPTVTGLVGGTGDRVTGLFQQYTDKFVGTGKELVVKTGYVVQDGNGGNNYTVTEQSNHQGVITAN